MIAHRALAVPVLVVAVLAAVGVSGCTTGDDELTPQRPRTTTITPSPTREAAAARVPVGDAGLDPSEPAWAQGSVLHVGTRRVDVTPRRVDAFVATRGGVYFLDGDELWFTDLSVVRGTGVTGVTRLEVDRDASWIRVTTGPSGARTVRAYDTESGRTVTARDVHPLSDVDRLGRPGQQALRSERSDVTAPTSEVPVRKGAGRFGLVDVEGGPLVAFDTTDGVRVPLTGVVGGQFELARWTGPSSFYGQSLDSGRPMAVLGCDLEARSCRTWGTVEPDEPLVFGS